MFWKLISAGIRGGISFIVLFILYIISKRWRKKWFRGAVIFALILSLFALWVFADGENLETFFDVVSEMGASCEMGALETAAPVVKPVETPLMESSSATSAVQIAGAYAFGQGNYLGRATRIEDVDRECARISGMLRRHKVEGRAFALPADIAIRQAEPSAEFETESTLTAYDGQIQYIFNCLTDGRDKSAALYYRLGVTALNALDLCEKLSGQVGWGDFQYYGEIALYGFSNWYVYGALSAAGQAGAYYQLGQVFDHLGTNTDTPGNQMTFVSLTFMSLAYQEIEDSLGEGVSLEKLKNEIYYFDDICEMFMTLLYRFGIHMAETEGFLGRLLEHENMALELALSDQYTRRINIVLEYIE